MNNEDPDPRVSARLLKRALAIRGNVERLAEFLAVRPADLAQWIDAKTFPPEPVFEKLLGIILDAHDQRFSRAVGKTSVGPRRRRVLLADDPEACAVLASMLGDELAFIPAHTFVDALRSLERESFDLIVCGQHFEGSQMLRLLEHVKADRRASRIPFICCRTLPTQLSATALTAMRQACEALGAVAYIDLPERESERGKEVAAVEFRDAVKAAVNFSPPRLPLRVLVADDNADAAHTLGVLLAMAGHEVQKVGDGVAALRTATLFRPAVAVLDIGMPQMSGYVVAERIRAEPWGEDVTLVALTGKADQIKRAFRVGFDHHFMKPVRVEHLLEVFP